MNTRTNTLRLSAQPLGTKGFFKRLRQMNSVWRQRAALSRLDPHMLDDLGLSDADVKSEISRPVWDVPSHWRQ